VALGEITGPLFGGTSTGPTVAATLRTLGFPVLHQHAEAKHNVLVEIIAQSGVPLAATNGTLQGNVSYQVIELKQYRDVPMPTQAAYQALVSILGNATITESHMITDTLTVRINDDATHPVAAQLGFGTPGPITLPPVVNAFWVKADITLPGGTVLPL
jgi:hypothetical protein